MKIDKQTVLDAARNYVSKGYSIIPLKEKGKTPAIPAWKQYQTRNPTDIELVEWFSDGNNNIGIVTGRLSGLTVVDFDTQEAITFAKQRDFPKGPLVETGKGFHAYCKYEEGHRNFQKKAGLPGIDLRGAGGYVVAPPSTHESGHIYQWVEGRGLDLPLPDAPEWLFAKTDTEKTPIGDIYDAKTGSRNESLTRLVGSFLNDHKGLTLPQLVDMASLWNKGLANPLPLDEVKGTCKSIYDRHHDQEPERQERRQVKAISITDFLKYEFAPKESILDPWLPSQGLSLIYAPRGIGKTFLALSIMVAVVSGSKILRWHAPKPRGVLYIDGEMPGNTMQERLSHIINSMENEPSAPLQIITPDIQPLEVGMPNLTTIEGQEAIEPYLNGISLVIVDNISTLCRGGRENESESWLPVQEWALKLRSRGLSVLFIHHAGKGGMQRGTSSREDILDTVISLRRPGDYTPNEGAHFEIHFEKSRGFHGNDAKPFDVKLVTIPNGMQEWVIKDLEESLTEKVASLLNDGVPQHEISKELNVTPGTVSKHKKKAIEQGLLKAAG